MRKCYLLLFATTFLSTHFVVAQDVYISWEEDYTMPYNGEEVTITGGDQTIYTNFYVKNIGADAGFIWRRDIISISSPGYSDQLCDDQICYTATGNPWICPSAMTISQGDSSLFQPKLLTSGYAGTAHMRYFVLDENENKLDSIDVVFTSTADVAEEKATNLDFSMFPNPSQKELTIQKASSSKESTVIFIDALGKEVLKTQMNNITMKVDISSLKNGIYFVQNINNKGVRSETKKLIVQK
ncbi:MAG: T9SS type A sorting domain-containing protein [Brumimicrobium sp.]